MDFIEYFEIKGEKIPAPQTNRLIFRAMLSATDKVWKGDWHFALQKDLGDHMGKVVKIITKIGNEELCLDTDWADVKGYNGYPEIPLNDPRNKQFPTRVFNKLTGMGERRAARIETNRAAGNELAYLVEQWDKSNLLPVIFPLDKESFELTKKGNYIVKLKGQKVAFSDTNEAGWYRIKTEKERVMFLEKVKGEELCV